MFKHLIHKPSEERVKEIIMNAVLIEQVIVCTLFRDLMAIKQKAEEPLGVKLSEMVQSESQFLSIKCFCICRSS